MKKTIYLSIFTMLSILTMQSCLKDQEDVFERPSSLRLQDVLENTHNTLTTQGLWTLDFYPRAEYYYGGYPMIFKFEKISLAVETYNITILVNETLLIKMAFE